MRGLAVLAVAVALATGCASADGQPAREEAPRAIAISAPAVISEALPPPAARAPVARPLRILVGGDLLPHRPSLVAPNAIASALAPLARTFATADVVVANYEASTGEVLGDAFRMAYAAPRGWMGALAKAGIGAVTVANNHACDLGESGVAATLDEARASDVIALGGDAVDPWAPRELAVQGTKRVCAVAWTTFSNAEGACARSRHLAIAPLSPAGKQRVSRALANARARCDATIAIVHGGEEYVRQTTQVVDQAAHAAEAGADAVVVHHPHVASPVVVHATRDGRNVPIFASVGNLVTNQGESWKLPMFPVLRENRRLVCVNAWTRLGVLADLSFWFDGPAPRLVWGTHLTWVDNEHADDRSAPVPKISARILDPTADRALVAKLSEDRSGPLALFSEPCWLAHESAGATGAAAEPSPRCVSPLVTHEAAPFLAAALGRSHAPAAKSRAGKHASSRRAK